MCDKMSFILKHSLEITANEESELLENWHKQISEEIHLSIATVKLCAMDTAAAAQDDEVSSVVLEYDGIDDEKEEKENEKRLYCICLTEFDEDRSYINCPKCEEAYHYDCVGLSYDEYWQQIESEEMTWSCGQNGCQ